MRGTLIFLALGFVGVGAYFASPTMGAIGGVVTAYLYVVVRPYSDCRPCKGSGKFRSDWVDARNFSLCGTCGGRGRFVRAFAPAWRLAPGDRPE